MPHIQIEHTKNIQTKITFQLFDKLINILNEFANIKSENCKCKVLEIEKYYTKSMGKNNKYIHLNIKILKGRPKTIISKIGRRAFQLLQSYFLLDNKENHIQYSVEIEEVNKKNYFTSNNIN